ncbi:MAG: type II toxin-antitoxin system RelE/ParE family toxin [Oscillospiraceae bacterium]|nr:type II toxin-antitoxin system RelE/ParE family toxin [Oscillospiraceae bacterium]
MSVEAYKVTYYDPDFQKSADRLVEKKKFRKLPLQIAGLLSELEKGNFDGKIIIRSDNPPYDVYKIRLPNNDTNEGKSNGYRVIYLAKHDDRTLAIFSIYYKKEQAKLADTYIRAMLDGYFLSVLPAESSDDEAEDSI